MVVPFGEVGSLPGGKPGDRPQMPVGHQHFLELGAHLGDAEDAAAGQLGDAEDAAAGGVEDLAVPR